MTERRLNMIIEKEYFDSEEVRKANAMNDKTMAPLRRIRLATTDSNKYYAKAVFVADKENIITGELLYRPDFQESEEGVAFSEVVVKQPDEDKCQYLRHCHRVPCSSRCGRIFQESYKV